MLKNLKADFQRYHDLFPKRFGSIQRFFYFLSCPSIWGLVDYRYRHWLHKRNLLLKVLLYVPTRLAHLAVLTLTGISIPTTCQIGPGLYIGHFTGIFLSGEGVFGKDISLSQGVTVGYGGKEATLGVPTVGDNVYFAPGCKVFGKITIGNNVKIGANAVVLKPVPDNSTAVGVPARIISNSKDSESDS